MSFERVAGTSEIAPGGMKKVTVKGQNILIVNVNGSYHAMGSVCTHMKGNLSLGTLEGDTITCPKHGQKFDVTTGKSVQGPKVAFIKMKGKDEQRYELRVEGNDILVSVE